MHKKRKGRENITRYYVLTGGKGYLRRIVPNFKEYYTDEDTKKRYYDFVEEKFVENVKEEAC